MPERFPHRQPHAAARGRRLAWLAALVLFFQLLGAVGHDHESSARAQECVACAVHAQALAAPPPSTSAPTPFNPALLHVAAVGNADAPPAVRAVWLYPPPQAPPASLLRT